ncbi:MAG: DUF3078 domain-containing protein [Bacteroidaceae bacterium]|nr:DUF3078 domain-containing protein [Bacteroidaceae bacterium]
MNKIVNFLFAVACTLFVNEASAQSSRQYLRSYTQKSSSVVSQFRDSLSRARQKSQIVSDDALSDDAAASPYLYRMFGPGVYYRSVVADKLSLDSDADNAMASKGAAYRSDVNSSINNVLFNNYVTTPSKFSYYDAQINSEATVDVSSLDAKVEDLSSIYSKVEEIKDVSEVVEDVDLDIQIEKPNFWKTAGKFSLQFTQNFLSDNWYKGGNSNVVMRSNLVLEANYNDQKKVQWDNKLDMRLGFMTVSSDSCHNYLTSDDKIYLFSKLGIKAAKSWFYTLSLEANSQFLPGYRSNDRRVYSDFIAPLDAYVSLGMDFKPTLKNGNSLSLALLPLSYKMRYIGLSDENIHKNYNMLNKDFQQDFGSKLEFSSSLKLVKDLVWKSRVKYFTSYKYTEAELENSLAFQFNKYFSTEVYTLWRFDDSRSKDFYDSKLGFFQFKEYFTLGLSYNF